MIIHAMAFMLSTRGKTGAAGNASALEYASVAIAGLAFVFSCTLGLLNRRTAKRALALAELQEARRESPLDLYVIGSEARRSGTTGDRVLEFHVLVSNPADRASSIVGAELHVTYSIDGILTTLKLRHDGGEASVGVAPGAAALELPVRLDANAAQSGLLRFRIGSEVMRRYSIDRYDLVVRDVHGIEESRQVLITGEVVDA